jgi:hypothetical protein
MTRPRSPILLCEQHHIPHWGHPLSRTSRKVALDTHEINHGRSRTKHFAVFRSSFGNRSSQGAGFAFLRRLDDLCGDSLDLNIRHCERSNPPSFRGWSAGLDPESRDSGFDASHRPGTTTKHTSAFPRRISRLMPKSSALKTERVGNAGCPLRPKPPVQQKKAQG